jgi:uncharacterized protein YnzC (UPF0291/DUF896 family)
MAITTLPQPMPKLNNLSPALSLDGAITLEIQQGVPIFRASTSVQERIENLLDKQRESNLTTKESEELRQYEEIDDYLSFVNRMVRNLLQTQRP